MFIQIVEDDFALSNGIRLALSQPGTEFIQNREVQEAQNNFQKYTGIDSYGFGYGE